MPDEFARVARSYALFRPLYPQPLLDAITTKASSLSLSSSSSSSSSSPPLLLDIGTGSGQLCLDLARKKELKKFHFLGIDKSKNQLEEARKRLNEREEKEGKEGKEEGEGLGGRVEFREGVADETGVGEGEVLVATVGQAAHWFVCI